MEDKMFQEMISEVDIDGDGEISIDEFEQMMNLIVQKQ